MPQKRQKVIVGMSGGVDSSVTALLLKQRSFDVIGVFMKNWSGESLGLSGEAARKWEQQCPWQKDAEDVRRVCTQLGIPHYTFNFEREYKEGVLDYFFREFQSGRTPNPDVMCNKEVKFKVFLEKARALGADFVATGHYARRVEISDDTAAAGGKRYEVHIPADTNKDQTYFLYTLTQAQLAHVLFPLADFTKTEVRALAAKHGLPTAAKPDSQGICFVGEVDIKEFLQTKIPRTPGPITTVEGETVGEHQGLAFYTIGQREGLGVGGTEVPLYVVGKDAGKNVLIVAKGSHHKALYSSALEASQVHWIGGAQPSLPLKCQARIRYRQELQSATVKPHVTSGGIIAEFEKPQRAVTPGQSIVLYDGTQMLGGAVIETAVV